MHRPDSGENFVAKMEAHGKRAREAAEQRRESTKVVRRKLNSAVEDLKRQIAVADKEAAERVEVPKGGMVSRKEELERLREAMEMQKVLKEKKEELGRLEALAMDAHETDSQVNALKQNMETIIRPFLQKTFEGLEGGGEEEDEEEEEEERIPPLREEGKEGDGNKVRPLHPDELILDKPFTVFAREDQLYFVCRELFGEALELRNFSPNLKQVDARHKTQVAGDTGKSVWCVDQTGTQEMLGRVRFSLRKLRLVLHLNRNYSVSFSTRTKSKNKCKMCLAYVRVLNEVLEENASLRQRLRAE
jgi:hypothetical protein